MRIIFATGNAHKMKEIREILQGLPGEICSMAEAGIDVPIEENGATFEENALIKARTVAAAAPGDLVLADDSGICIDALDGEPGIHSARFLGEETPHSEKNAEILRRLSGVPEEKRGARFVCAVAAVLPDGSERVVRGTFEGRIAERTAGANGFGYDPIFFVPECGCTSAELTPEEKNARSHRGKALRGMREVLEGVL